MINVYERIETIKKLVRSKFPDLTDEQIKQSLNNLCRYQDKTKKKVSFDEYAIKELLIENGYTPKTVYSYYAVFSWPEWLQDKLKQGMPLKQARTLRREYICKTDKQTEGLILKEIRQYVAELKEFKE